MILNFGVNARAGRTGLFFVVGGIVSFICVGCVELTGMAAAPLGKILQKNK
ncbi:hypothetical protein ACFQHW_03560 [Lapidilactobacillus achengensis]|uniref:Uncharacterized protein n=1 Tax=Lapidilactobacillus achengensis TaxID=2486000 RepID=A0ABW1UNP0_9LACO|nr:hypothetical protein [Lapidilactobacillus achengensis]